MPTQTAMLTQLASVARRAGLDVVEVSGWRERGHGGMKAPRTITVHHTAGPSAKRDASNYPSLRTVRDGRPDLRGPLAQLGLGRDGTVYVIAAGLAWHAGTSRHIDYTNSYAVGIECENNGVGEPWPTRQLSALQKLCAALAVEFGLDAADVRGHNETCDPVGRKIDPAGVDMNVLRAGVGRRMDDLRASRDDDRDPVAPVKPAQPAAPKPPAFTLDRVLRVVDGDLMHGRDVKGVQLALMARGYALPEWGADSYYGDEVEHAVRRFQKHKRIDVDGRVGKVTTKALGGRWTG